jgi:S1-C subfamily serine protease
LDINDVEWTVPSQDWAAITFDMKHKMSCVQVATKEEFEAIKPFERIYAIGCAKGYGQFCRMGIIGTTHNEHRNIHYQTTKSPWPWDIHPERFFRPYVSIWFGDSGGGVYNKEGKLIGIINAFGMTSRVTHSTIAFKTHIMLDVLQHSKDFFLVED